MQVHLCTFSPEIEPPRIEEAAPNIMCYIDLQHYIHCKHTDAQMRCCRDPWTGQMNLDGDHNVFRAETHSYHRLCCKCYQDAVERAGTRASQLLADFDRGDVRTQIEFESTAEILKGNREHVENEPFGVNEHLGGKTIACMFDGGIDREKALREPRDAFRNRPTHIGKDGKPLAPEMSEPAFIPAGTAWDADYVNHDSDPTTNTKEILLYFSKCGHFNGLWCEQLVEQDGGFVARCGCERFDEKLATKQYAESAGLCLLCRRTRVAECRSLLTEMVREISGARELALWPMTQRRPYKEVR